MTKQIVATPQPIYSQVSLARPSLSSVSPWFNWFVVLICFTDIFTPVLISKKIVPESVRWISDFAVVILLAVLFLRMFVFDRFPLGIWVLAGLSILGIVQASLHGQDIFTTLWGWWQTFQSPMFAVYAYLNPHWPSNFPQKLRQLCLGILGFQLFVQLIQYITGEPPGDHLSGTFGAFGVSQLLLFSVLTISLTLGYGVAKNNWWLFLLAFGIGIVSSSLAENKIFPVSTVLLSFLAVPLYVFQGGKIVKLLPYLFLLIVGLSLFFVTYNFFVPVAEHRPLEQFLYDEETFETYTQFVRPSDPGSLDFKIGRNFAVEFGWNFIRSHPDPTVFLFGLGLGARSESTSFGLVGIAFEQSGLGLARGTGLMILLQEMGLAGVAAVSVFVIVLSYRLMKDMLRYRNSAATELRAGLIVFSLLWPLWLWYKPAFWYRPTMIIYWVAIGYVFYQRHQDQLDLEQSVDFT